MSIRIRVTGICVVENKNLLLIKEDVQGWPYAIPGGGVKAGETITEALVWEFKEELNIKITVENKIVYCSEYDRIDGVHVIEIAMLVSTKDRIESDDTLVIPLHKIAEYIRQDNIVTALQNIQPSLGSYLGMREA